MRIINGAFCFFLAVNYTISTPVTAVKSVNSKNESGNAINLSLSDSSPKQKRETSTGDDESEPEDPFRDQPEDPADSADSRADSRFIDLEQSAADEILQEIQFRVQIVGTRDVDSLVDEFSERFGLRRNEVRELVQILVQRDEARLSTGIPSEQEGLALIDYGIFSDPELLEYVEFALLYYADGSRDAGSLTRRLRSYWTTIPDEQVIVNTVIRYEDVERLIREEMDTGVLNMTPYQEIVLYFIEKYRLDEDWTRRQIHKYFDRHFWLSIRRFFMGP